MVLGWDLILLEKLQVKFIIIFLCLYSRFLVASWVKIRHHFIYLYMFKPHWCKVIQTKYMYMVHLYIPVYMPLLVVYLLARCFIGVTLWQRCRIMWFLLHICPIAFFIVLWVKWQPILKTNFNTKIIFSFVGDKFISGGDLKTLEYQDKESLQAEWIDRKHLKDGSLKIRYCYDLW